MRFFILALIIAFTTSACREEQTESTENTVRPVRVLEVTETSELHERFFVGVARAAREATLAFGVPGTVQEIKVAVGDQVSKGDRMAELDPSTFQSEVARLEADCLAPRPL